MSNAEWSPFGLTEDEAVEYDVLVSGVPAWMRTPLLAWIRHRMKTQHQHWLLADVVHQAAAALRLDLGDDIGEAGMIPESRAWPHIASLNDQDLLRLTDWLLAHRRGYEAAVDQLLTRSRSKYQVGTRSAGLPGLVERVPEGTQAVVEAAIATPGDAGRLLARAWAHVHGLEPNDPAAYADAVRAVEIAGTRVVTPNNLSAHLGHVIGQMKADGDWRLPLREHADAPGPETVLMMLRTLWGGHSDRHGHGKLDYKDVTHEQARAAVVLAASLVEWFNSGALTRR